MRICLERYWGDGQFVEQIVNGESKSISIFQLERNLCFGSSADLENKLSDSYSDSKIFLIHFKGVSIFDVTALEVIEVPSPLKRSTGSHSLPLVEVGVSGIKLSS
ncbi:STAS domain-containing protein [Desulfosporosinus fructosivorans]|uniref:STAS domain-containing protein n=1 Tax=Desulfosporosinus fructosivorans TaxID=2018669 RepID=UPI0030846282